MEFIKTEKGLKITIDETDKKFLSEVSEDNHHDLGSSAAEIEFFSPYLEDNDWDWIDPEEISALTSAPILGIRGEYDKVIEAYGYMDYAVYSMLEELETQGEIFLEKG